METIESIIKQVLQRKIQVELTLKDDEIAYVISGFYKSGTVTLYQAGYNVYVKARYDEVDKIESFDELVSINYHWWQRSKERYDGWVNPDEAWIEDLIRLNYVKRKEQTVITYE